MRLIATLALAAAAALTSAAQAEDITVKLGVLNDMSSLYADIGGQGSVLAAKMAVEDFNPAAHGMKVEIISADHLNKPDVGANIAKQWIDVDHVDAILDVPTSSVALAVNEVVRDKNKVFLVSGAAISDLTGTKCSPNTVHWTYDTWMLAHGTAGALVKTGGDTWFFLTSDYAFGHALERDATAVVLANGGRVLGAVAHPLNTQDFSSFLLQAQASKAKIIGLANAGGDTDNAIKQGAEFGIAAGGQQFAGLLVFIANDVEALSASRSPKGPGPDRDCWYWDMNDATRAFWTKRWQQSSGRANSRRHEPVAGRLFGDHALPEDGRRAQKRRRRQGGSRQDERTSDRRSAVRQRLCARRWPENPPRICVRGEEAGGVKISGRRLQAARHHSGSRSVPAAERRRLSAGQ